jgi:hypothetical protein
MELRRLLPVEISRQRGHQEPGHDWPPCDTQWAVGEGGAASDAPCCYRLSAPPNQAAQSHHRLLAAVGSAGQVNLPLAVLLGKGEGELR